MQSLKPCKGFLYEIVDVDSSICKPMTQREIAKELGISHSYISRIEKKELEQLRREI